MRHAGRPGKTSGRRSVVWTRAVGPLGWDGGTSRRRLVLCHTSNESLKADADGPDWADLKIAEPLDCSTRTVEFLRERKEGHALRW
jgi:hypothetical protein